MKTEPGVKAMRGIAEEACELVRRFKGSFSGEHGDGISRSDFVEWMFGGPLTRTFEQVKDGFNPGNRLSPARSSGPITWTIRPCCGSRRAPPRQCRPMIHPHGIGITNHEYPEDMAFNQRALLADEVYSVEPGIYVYGVGGFRCADVVVVGDKPRLLTRAPKDLASQTLN